MQLEVAFPFVPIFISTTYLKNWFCFFLKLPVSWLSITFFLNVILPASGILSSYLILLLFLPRRNTFATRKLLRGLMWTAWTNANSWSESGSLVSIAHPTICSHLCHFSCPLSVELFFWKVTGEFYLFSDLVVEYSRCLFEASTTWLPVLFPALDYFSPPNYGLAGLLQRFGWLQVPFVWVADPEWRLHFSGFKLLQRP